MRAGNPGMKVLVAQLIPMNPSGCTGCAQRVVDFNARIPDWARATSTSHSPITVVDEKSPVSGWTATVVPADGARLTQVWNGTSTTADDGTVTVTDAT